MRLGIAYHQYGQLDRRTLADDELEPPLARLRDAQCGNRAALDIGFDGNAAPLFAWYTPIPRSMGLPSDMEIWKGPSWPSSMVLCG